MEKLNLTEKLSLFSEHWTPKTVAQSNGQMFKLAKVQGEFVWHDHPDVDEVFYILKGTLRIEFESEVITLDEGEMLVVPAGVKHKPVADEECHILLVEPSGVVNTGDAGGELTAPVDDWI